MKPDVIKANIKEVWDAAVAQGTDPRHAVVRAANEADEYWHSADGVSLRRLLRNSAAGHTADKIRFRDATIKVAKLRALAGLLYPEYWSDISGYDEPDWVWSYLADDYRQRLGIEGGE